MPWNNVNGTKVIVLSLNFHSYDQELKSSAKNRRILVEWPWINGASSYQRYEIG